MFEPLQISLRVVLALVFLFAITKFLTKRNLANSTHFDYVATVTLGTITGNVAFNLEINVLNLLLAMLLVTIIIMGVSKTSFKHRALRKFLAGNPTTLIKNGKILEKNMADLNYSFDHLEQQLRHERVFDISEVECAILEPNGNLSVQVKSENQVLRRKDINLHTQNEGLATEVVLDGKVVDNGLSEKGLSKEWVYKELKKKGIKDIHEVAFAAISTNGNLYVDLYSDQLENKSNE